MKKIYLKLQAPTIELKIEAKDASKTDDSVIVGFKRYNLAESKTHSETLKSIQDGLYNLAKIRYKKEFERLGSVEQAASLETIETNETEESLEQKLTDFIASQIVYLKDVTLTTVDDNGAVSSLKIQDTRTAKPVELLWETPTECLNVLVSSLLESLPYRSSLIAAQDRALANINVDEPLVKN